MLWSQTGVIRLYASASPSFDGHLGRHLQQLYRRYELTIICPQIALI